MLFENIPIYGDVGGIEWNPPFVGVQLYDKDKIVGFVACEFTVLKPLGKKLPSKESKSNASNEVSPINCVQFVSLRTQAK